MTKKQAKSKKAGSPRKAPKVSAFQAALAATRTPTRERDPRLPAAGTVLKRTFKGRELKVTVLADGFRFEGEEFRSLSALAMKITGYAAINGVAWWKLTTPKPATPTKAPKVKPVAPAKVRAPKVRRAGRDAAPVATTAVAPEVAPAAEPAEAGA